MVLIGLIIIAVVPMALLVLGVPGVRWKLLVPTAEPAGRPYAAGRRTIDSAAGAGVMRCCSPEISTGQRAL
jgi:hypothetical protein